MRIVFLIHSLLPGGAERQLVTLVRNLDPGTFAVTVVTFYAGGRLAEELSGLANVTVASAHKQGRGDVLGFLWRSWKLVRHARPQIIHGYMFGANEMALLFGRVLRSRVVWGIRASGLQMEHYGWRAGLLRRTGAWLSGCVDAVIANSQAGRDYHVGIGYPAHNVIVIPNGIDTLRYQRDPQGRQRVRQEWQVGDQEVLIGIVARIDPMKDHVTFLRAAARLVQTEPSARFAIVGSGSAEDLQRLKSMAEQCNVSQRLVWAGARQDMSAVYSALDVATSSSAFGEGFSNSLAEAMACETICVGTDVGDARILIADTGEVVRPREPEALALAWERLIAATPAQRRERGRSARARIVDSFSVATLVRRTTEALLRMAPQNA